MAGTAEVNRRRSRTIDGLQNRPVGSPNWYGQFRDATRQPYERCVKLKAHTEDAARREYNALRERWGMGDFDPWRKRQKKVRQRPSIGKVYVLKIDGLNIFKVGYCTSDFYRRLNVIQVSCPLEVSVYRLFEVKHPMAFEQTMHAALSDYHLRGEWFELSEKRFRSILAEQVASARSAISTERHGHVTNRA